MRLLKLISLLFLFVYQLNANTTICYKKNQSDIENIEKVIFNGGECAGKYSILDMKNNNWLVDDIKIITKNGKFDFVYILKTKEIKYSNIDYKLLASNIKEKKDLDIKNENLINGEKLYNKVCKSCHGIDATKSLNNKSRNLSKMSEDEFKEAILNYQYGDYTSGSFFIMKQYADTLTKNDINNLHLYLKNIK